jgi:hypothetical protein
MELQEWAIRAARAQKTGHQVLATHGSPHSRVVLLEDLAKQLGGAPIDVQDYFGESIQCLESGLYRS